MPMQTINPIPIGPRKEALVKQWKDFRTHQVQPLQEYLDCAKQLIDSGAALLAYDVVKIGLRHYPVNVRLLQKMGFALSRGRVTVEAYEIARKLYHEMGLRDEESIGLLAHTLKDFWEQCRDPQRKAEYLRLSANYYAEAYNFECQHSGDSPERGYWTGINAATLAFIQGDSATAESLAGRVYDQCRKLESRSEEKTDNEYWVLATLGEACLILGCVVVPNNADKLEEAFCWYQKASKIAYQHRMFGSLGATLRQARLFLPLANLSNERRNELLDCFRLPRIVTFAGHMIDAPGRKPPRFPAELESTIREAIDNKLEEYGPIIGYSSAACGSDILFLEAAQARDYDTFIFLPYERCHFAKDSVEIAGGNWGERYETVLQKAREVITVSPHQRISWGSVTYDYCNIILNGLAAVHAQRLECEIKRLCVWNKECGDGPGGTSTIVERWRQSGKDVEIIDPRKLNPVSETPPTLDIHCSKLSDALLSPWPLSQGDATNDLLDRLIVKALLFADIRHYSRLTEEHMPAFIEHFYGLVSRLIHRSPTPPVATEDRGDGIYCVFDTAWQAAHFALNLNDCMKRLPWNDLIGRDLQLRIGLHCGPIHEFTNPITGRLSYTGTHVSRAARIEPVAPPGQVYASREFAALASVERPAHSDHDFTCAYVGLTEWHKDYGVEPTFQVRRRFR